MSYQNQPDDFWALNHPTAQRIALNDCSRNDQFASVSAQSCRGSSAPSYVSLIINGAGFSMHSGNTTERARALARALVEAADICDAFEAEQTLKEERETAMLNMHPVQRMDGVQFYDLGVPG